MAIEIKTTVSASVEPEDLAKVLLENPGVFAEVWDKINAPRIGLSNNTNALQRLGQAIAYEDDAREAFTIVYDAMRFYARQRPGLIRKFEEEIAGVAARTALDDEETV